MRHEPECIATDGDCGCICDLARAAYHRGYEKGFGDGHEQGYRAGYNDHAAAQQHWQDTHGVYRKPVPGNPGVYVNSSPHFIQHGEGENP